MDPEISTALAELNRAFYIRFAGDFARTRRAWPPGFDVILPHFRPAINLLDVGCGNARLLTFLAARGWQGAYTGLDGSPGLLEVAEEAARGLRGIRASFVLADLLDPGWPARLADRPPFDVVSALAVLHHIPGAAARGRFMMQCAELLAPGGKLVVSTWQFMTSTRLQQRVLPWSVAGLSEAEVEPGDYLVAWGEGAAGYRYCASINEDDLSRLGAGANLALVQSLYADGHEGNLNLYAIFRKGEQDVTAR